MQLFPAFQYLYEFTGDAGVSAAGASVYGAEALARTGQDNSFQRPPGRSWRSIDYGMAQVLAGAGVAGIPVEDSRLFLNVSQYSLADDASFERWLAAVSELSSILQLNNSSQLVIEVTEMIPEQMLKTRWDMIKAEGFLMAIDDFGTGESKQKRLVSHDWDLCKFDMSILGERELITALRHCDANKVVGIAEKIETEDQGEYALDLGIKVHQGYFYGKPSMAQNLVGYQHSAVGAARNAAATCP